MSLRIGTLTIAAILLGNLGSATAQVQVTVSSKSVKVKETIEAKVWDRGSESITYCAEFGQSSPRSEDMEIGSTPTPFYVQRLVAHKWSTLLTAPDIGSVKQPIVLSVRRSNAFTLSFIDTGKLRLVLEFWAGAQEKLNCADPPKRGKIVRSDSFSVVP